jgi:hypothetical protein
LGSSGAAQSPIYHSCNCLKRIKLKPLAWPDAGSAQVAINELSAAGRSPRVPRPQAHHGIGQVRREPGGDLSSPMSMIAISDWQQREGK